MSHDQDAVCRCQADHRPAPLELHRHHVWPLAMGGPERDENVVWICPTTHTNIHELLALMLRADEPLTDRGLSLAYEQPVSRYAAEVARRGFRCVKERTVLP